jgi:antibiotic biosynthesis monooxygenase (ABM) superfamily enzyme
MIYHNLRISLRSNVTPAQKESLLEKLREQGRVMKTVVSYSIGQDVGGEFEYAAVFTFNTAECYKAYLSHPRQVQTEAFMLPLVAELDVFTLVDDSDPKVGDEIVKLRTRPSVHEGQSV